MARLMKDSGVEWIGEIPEEWAVVKCKHIATVQAGFPFDSAKFSNSEGTPLIRIRDITSGFTQTYYSGEYDSAYIVSKGDLLIGMDGDFNIRMWQSENALLNQRCCRVLSNTDIELSFLYYSLPFHLEITNNLAYATTVKHLSNSDVLNAPIPYPPKSIRESIISLLNNKCAEIDKVVEQTRATIEEYKNLKQAIITEAVTKGVRGPRPMKPSGVGWIGDIPEEWSKDKIGRVCNLIGSGTTPKFDRFDLSSADIPWIQSGDLSSTHLHNVKTYVTRDIIDAHSALKVYEPPFIAVAMYGASIGNTSISSFSACVNQACCVLTPGTFNLSYLYYIIMACKPYFMYQGEGGGQPNISQEKIKQTWIPVPNPIEQQEIAAYLDTKCAEIDRIIEKKEQLIEELGSYKKSLIYEYVTGKKEVTA